MWQNVKWQRLKQKNMAIVLSNVWEATIHPKHGVFDRFFYQIIEIWRVPLVLVTFLWLALRSLCCNLARFRPTCFWLITYYWGRCSSKTLWEIQWKILGHEVGNWAYHLYFLMFLQHMRYFTIWNDSIDFQVKLPSTWYSHLFLQEDKWLLYRGKNHGKNYTGLKNLDFAMIGVKPH